MTEFKLTLTTEEREYLTGLLETLLNEKRVEEHRTRAPSYREHLVHQDELISAMLQKLRQLAA